MKHFKHVLLCVALGVLAGMAIPLRAEPEPARSAATAEYPGSTVLRPEPEQGLTQNPANVPRPSKTPFSPWMSIAELNAYLEKLDGDKPDGKNYWERGNWINAVQGRFEDGIMKLRIAYEPVPEGRAHWWLWYYNQLPSNFEKQMVEHGDQGFTLVYWNSFTMPGGGVRMQGVWHKFVPLGGAVPREGTYILTEQRGAPYTGPQVSITIKDKDRIYGRCGQNIWKGSVSAGFSNKMTPLVSDMGTSDERQEDRVLRVILEQIYWKMDGDKLSAVSNGRTVARFSPATETEIVDPNKSDNADKQIEK